MRVARVSAEVSVTDLDAAVTWYQQLFGRPPDQRPMDGLAEWQLTDTGWLQVFLDTERASRSLLTLGVDDLEAQTAILRERGLAFRSTMTTPRGQRLGSLTDPAGNVITAAEEPPATGVSGN